MKANPEVALESLDGSLSPVWGNIVVAIAGYIEHVFEAHPEIDNKAVVLELEGRIGVLKDYERIRLPVETEVLLDPPNSQFSYRFDSGVSQYQFNRLKSKLHEVIALEEGGGGGHIDPNSSQSDYSSCPSTVPTSAKHLSTRDEIFEVVDDLYFEAHNIRDEEGEGGEVPSGGGRQVRMSYRHPKMSGDTPREVIWKRRLNVLNIYTGRDKEESNVDLSDDRSLVDIRIAVNIEYKLYKMAPSKSKKVMTRLRNRTSYPLKGKFRIDMTEVQTEMESRMASDRPPLYEVELEVNPKILKEEVRKKTVGQENHLHGVIGDFLKILKDFSSYLNSSNVSSSLSHPTRYLHQELPPPSSSAPSSAATSATVDGGGSQQQASDHQGSLPTEPSGQGDSHLPRQTGRNPPSVPQAGRESEGGGSGGAPVTKRRKIHFADLTSCCQPEEVVDKFVKYLSPVVPIIGDYLFRAVLPELQNAKCPELNEEDIKESVKQDLTQQELIALKEKLSKQDEIY